MLPPFADLAAEADPPLDLLALALAAEFRAVDAAEALAELDALGAELAGGVPEDPAEQARVLAEVLGVRHGFTGERSDYDHPANSMLDIVLERRRGLPILLSVVYVEVARRAAMPVLGVGLPGHFVVGHFGAEPPLLLDPFSGGARVEIEGEVGDLRPWEAHEIALRMLNNLTAAFRRRGDLGNALRAGELRTLLPAAAPLRETLEVELRALRAQLN